MKKIVIPFALTVLSTLMASCGGEENTIHENPTQGGEVTANASCDTQKDECLSFTLEYPIGGINFTCSSDKVNHFVTKFSGNAAQGACELGDTVTFYLQGVESIKRIELGKVDLDTIAQYKNQQTTPQISFIDMAAGALNASASSLTPTDPAIKLATKFTKMFQAFGAKQSQSVVGDIQPLVLSQEDRNALVQLDDSITIEHWKTDNFAQLLKPWLDVSTVSDDDSFEILKKLNHINHGGLYTADLVQLFLTAEGFHGESQVNSNKKSINLLYMLTNRKGQAFGYGMQWVGIPKLIKEDGTEVVSDVSRINLLATENPAMMLVEPITDWLDPLKKNITINNPLKLKNVVNDSIMQLNQGRLINNMAIAGSDDLYKSLARTETVQALDLGRWTQTISGEAFTGNIDVYKSLQMTYLDKQVFRTEKNVKAGEKYVFPLYATLSFSFDDGVTPVHTLGIVIDEDGDIRTDIAANATDTNMTGQCGTVDETLKDNYGVQQYNVGTTATASYNPQALDMSVPVRMIFAGNQFKALNGAMIGLDTVRNDVAIINLAGAKINVNNLLTSESLVNGINITDFNNNAVHWANVYNTYKQVFVNGKDNVSTEEEKAMAKRLSGRLAIKVADCYSLKVKS